MAEAPHKLILVIADFHKEIAATMEATARATAAKLGVSNISTYTVAGCYELPLIIDLLLERLRPDVLVALGYIERGETLDGEVMGNVVNRALVELQLKHHRPIGVGMIGPGATKEQALVRAEPKARGAVEAVVRTYTALHQIERN